MPLAAMGLSVVVTGAPEVGGRGASSPFPGSAGSKEPMDIRSRDTPAGSQIAIALTAEELEALGRGTLTVTFPEGTEGMSGVAQLVLSGPA